MKRVFVAIKIELNDQFKQVWQQLKNDLKQENIRWVPDENLHLTLRFLGNVAPHQVEQVEAALDGFCYTQNGFSFQLERLGHFKKRGKPAVIFIDIAQSDALADFVNKLENTLTEIGFDPNMKFKPHLTLGRVKHVKDEHAFYNCLDRFDQAPAQQIDVRQIVFYESILKPDGPEYKVMKRFKLN
ncbi:MAG TPA: RNA 2',3'-cyclic phosphodiesterase [Sunxiuqinia sp.]|nr:RNA 2',3'-cyclic phosphodiesterase [Sunxiuqinia sp.]